MPTTLQVKKAIRRGLKYIEKNQLKDGSFLSETREGNLLRWNKTIFFNAETLFYLNHLSIKSQTTTVSKKLAGFIMSQQSSEGSFCYWERNSTRESLLPEDIDDTACALLALSRHLCCNDITPPTYKFLRLLQKQRRNGYFTTWIDSKIHTDDYDVIVQANINATLKLLLAIEVPLSKELLESNDTSKYYVDSSYQKLCLSRSGATYSGCAPPKKAEYPCWNTTISLLISNKACTQKQLKRIYQAQQRRAYWKAPDTICESICNGKKSFGSSQILATVFAVIALQNYLSEQESAFFKKEISRSRKYLPQVDFTKLTAHTSKILEDKLAVFMVFLPKIAGYPLKQHAVYVRICGLIGLTWLNQVVDGKKVTINNNLGHFSLMVFTRSYTKLATLTNTRKIWQQLLRYQYFPPGKLDYRQNFFTAYTNRIGAASYFPELHTNSDVKRLIHLTLAVCSLSDDVHDLFEDRARGTLTGVSTLIRDKPIAKAKLYAHTIIVSWCEKILQTHPNIKHQKLATYCYQLVEMQYIASRCILLSRRCQRYLSNLGT